MKDLTITAFAQRFGLSRATLLYYDRIGLLKPGGVSDAGYRLYGEAELKRMKRIETFRQAGLPLKAIRTLLDGKTNNSIETALEHRLSTLNEEIAQLHAQQALVIRLLGRKGKLPRYKTVTVKQWVKMMEEAGINEDGQLRWHRAFERDAPKEHQKFLLSLGLSKKQIQEIRHRSRDGLDT